MTIEELKSELKAKNFKNVYLLYGDEKNIVKSITNEIIDALLSPEEKNIGLKTFAEKPKDEELLEALQANSFFSAKNVVIVENWKNLQNSKKNKQNEFYDKLYDIKENYDLFKKIPTTSHLIINCLNKVDKRNKEFKMIDTVGNIIEINNHKLYELMNFMRNYLRNKNIKIKDEVINFLYEIWSFSINVSFEYIEKELEKLILFLGECKEITSSSIKEIIFTKYNISVFKFIDVFCAKEKLRSIELFQKLMVQGENIFVIIALLTRQLRFMLILKEHEKKGTKINNSVPFLSIKQYTIKKLQKFSKNYSIKKMRRLLCDIAEFEYKAKKEPINSSSFMTLLCLAMI